MPGSGSAGLLKAWGVPLGRCPIPILLDIFIRGEAGHIYVAMKTVEASCLGNCNCQEGRTSGSQRLVSACSSVKLTQIDLYTWVLVWVKFTTSICMHHDTLFYIVLCSFKVLYVSMTLGSVTLVGHELFSPLYWLRNLGLEKAIYLPRIIAVSHEEGLDFIFLILHQHFPHYIICWNMYIYCV